MTTVPRPTDVELQLQSSREPVRHVGRVESWYGHRGKTHIRREVSFGRDEAHKSTLCGQPHTIGFRSVAEAIRDVSEIDCRSCRAIAGLGPITPR